MNKNVFEMEHGSVVDSSLAAQLVQRFVADTTIDIFCEKIKLSVSRNVSYPDLLYRLKELLTSARFVAPTLNSGYVFLMGNVGADPVLIFCSTGNRQEYHEDDETEDDEGAMNVMIDIYSTPLTAGALKAAIGKMFVNEKLAKIRWWYQAGDGRTQSHDFYLQRQGTKLHAEFYPDIGDPYKFMDEYLSSPAAVLLLAGPPGTGKTTLLRHMISERNLLAHVIYDEKLMERDTLFQNFLFDKESDIMIIEDADTILLAREHDGNKLMARFLSVSDGLIKLPNKKLVFTTNISDFSKVDQALLRPGRCHAMVHTRPLNLPEAQAAAKVADLPVPSQKGEYTLAELFNSGYRPKTRQIGFIAR